MPLYMCLHKLLNLLVQITNEMVLQKMSVLQDNSIVVLPACLHLTSSCECVLVLGSMCGSLLYSLVAELYMRRIIYCGPV
jgi:hypothetical protein